LPVTRSVLVLKVIAFAGVRLSFAGIALLPVHLYVYCLNRPSFLVLRHGGTNADRSGRSGVGCAASEPTEAHVAVAPKLTEHTKIAMSTHV
jgi:hypothetical protein